MTRVPGALVMATVLDIEATGRSLHEIVMTPYLCARAVPGDQPEQLEVPVQVRAVTALPRPR